VHQLRLPDVDGAARTPAGPMIPDRITLVIACAIAAVPLFSLSPSVQQALGVVYTVHALRAHRRELARLRRFRNEA
jgi:hypothetical protein